MAQFKNNAIECEINSKLSCAWNNMSKEQKKEFEWKKINGRYGFFNSDGKTLNDLTFPK